MRIFVVPSLISITTVFGLFIALLEEGMLDYIASFLVFLPIAIIIWFIRYGKC